jgi:hypothetical protein
MMSKPNKNTRATGAEVAARSSRRKKAAPQLHPALSSGATGATSYRQMVLDGFMARRVDHDALPPAPVPAPPATAAPRKHTHAPTDQFKRSMGEILTTYSYNLRLCLRHRITEPTLNSWTNLCSSMLTQQCLLRHRPTATWPPTASVWNRTNTGWSWAHSTCTAKAVWEAWA